MECKSRKAEKQVKVIADALRKTNINWIRVQVLVFTFTFHMLCKANFVVAALKSFLAIFVHNFRFSCIQLRQLRKLFFACWQRQRYKLKIQFYHGKHVRNSNSNNNNSNENNMSNSNDNNKHELAATIRLLSKVCNKKITKAMACGKWKAERVKRK